MRQPVPVIQAIARYSPRCIQCGCALISDATIFCDEDCLFGKTAPFMTATEFGEARNALGLSFAGLGALLGEPLKSQIIKYEKGTSEIPGTVVRFLRIIMHRKLLQRDLHVENLSRRFPKGKAGRPTKIAQSLKEVTDV